ncbi:hypothetical protein [Nostoc sp.]|uniref:hypothetical protein n=1 Tax=Nostoc sp. TaxID=1180 RepID=UPI002FF73EFD
MVASCVSSNLDIVQQNHTQPKAIAFLNERHTHLDENSSHMPHLEETERFLQVLGEFLNRVEAAL